MRTALLIAATAAALTLSACNRNDEAATDTATEAAEASGTAADTGAMSAEPSAAGGASSGSGYGSGSGSSQTMDTPSGSGSMSDGAMAPGAQPNPTAGNNVTETQRRLNPPTTAPAQ